MNFRRKGRLARILGTAVLLIGALFFLLLHGSAQASRQELATAKLSPTLQVQLQNAQPAEMTTVILRVRGRANLSNARTGSRRARLNLIVTALKNHAAARQKRLINVLRTRQFEGSVDSFESFWIFNGLAVTATPDVIAELAAYPEVVSVTENRTFAEPVQTANLTPEQNIQLVNAPALWDLGYTGQGLVIASLDSGVDVSHVDLAAQYRGGSNSWFDPYQEFPNTPTDLSGHGTFTMGIMVGQDAGGSSIGIAPDAQWIAARIFNNQGVATEAAIHAAFQWLLDPDGNPATDDAPHVVNNSWTLGFPGCDLSFQADLQSLRAAGILPIFAAGNVGGSFASSTSPGNNPEAFAVGGVNNFDNLYPSSSLGPSACGEATTIFPEIVAPAVNILSTDLYGMYTVSNGTSAAAPHAAGALALLLQAYPELTVEEQEAALLNGAVDLGDPGADNLYGNGRLDILASYQYLYLTGGGLPTATPTATAVPATATNTSLPPTATNTPLPPTATHTPLPPTATATPLPPTSTPLPPTHTSVPPTATPGPTCSGSQILFVSKTTWLTTADQALMDWLTSAGHTIEVRNQYIVSVNDATGKDLVLVSDTVKSSKIGTMFRDVTIPVMTWEAGLYPFMAMTGSTENVDWGEMTGETAVTLTNPGHPLAAGLNGAQTIVTGGDTLFWGEPGTAAAVAADGPNGAPVIFGYESGAAMVGMSAPARRVGFANGNGAAYTTSGWALFEAAVSWSLNCGGGPAPTATPVPLTATVTPLPPTATHTPLPPTATPTHTSLPPTATITSLPPTPTSTTSPATATQTSLPATATQTPLPSTATNTPLPPTSTPLPPTATSLPPTATPGPTCSGSQILFVSKTTSLTTADQALVDWLTSEGHTIEVRNQYIVDVSDANGKDLVLVSDTVKSSKIGSMFRDVTLPVMTWEAGLYPFMAMTGSTENVDWGEMTGETAVTLINSGHPLAAGLSGAQPMVTSGDTLFWGEPGTAAAVAADGPNGAPVIFGYESGAAMMGMSAPARRVGFANGNGAAYTASGWALFEAAVSWSLNCGGGPAPTATPTNTPLPPTATNTPVAATATQTPPAATATNTPSAPTATYTAAPPTATATATSLPPTATATPLPPTPTPISPTATPGPTCGGSQILFVSKTTWLTTADQALVDWLTSAGHTIEVRNQYIVSVNDATGKDLVLVSDTVKSSKIGTMFRDVTIPVMTWEAGLYPFMAMTGATENVDWGEMTGETAVTLTNPGHPLAAGLNGAQTIVTGGDTLFWGEPGTAAAVAADGPNGAPVIFGYESGAAMVGMSAPARRVGFANGNGAAYTTSGWALFEAAISWSLNCGG